MKRVYLARTPFEAHFVKGILESRGIEAEVRGEEIFGVRGEVPMTTDTLPSVWIHRAIDEPAALDVVKRYESSQGPADAGAESWTCPSCGERLEGQFTACWNCGGSKPAE